MAVDKTIYGKDSIESLDPRSHVRLRPGMYVGNTSNPNHLLVEIFSNSLDEYNIGHGDTIYVNIEEDGHVEVSDNGQGFPIDQIRDDGESVLQASFDVMNTSGKFSEDGVYSGSSLGLNGEGSKLSNFLSKEFIVTSWNNGKQESVSFKDGIMTDRSVKKSDKANSGTTIRYLPDAQFFDTDKTDIKFFTRFFNNVTCLCNGLTVVFNGNSISHKSISDMIDINMSKQCVEIVDDRFVLSSDTFSCAMTFTSNQSQEIFPYVNYGITSIGPHITAIKSTITRCLNKFARENGYLKDKDKNLDGASVQEGMIFVCNIISKNVSYVAQVKSEIASLDMSFVSSLGKALEIWLDSNPVEAGKIVEKAIVARKASEAAKRARAAVKNKSTKTSNIKMPTSLVDCYCKDRMNAELFICEGKSAQGGLVAARDSTTQAVYGVRGKMLSVLKTNPENIIKNQEINNLLQALGLSYDVKTCKCVYDKKKLRYGKIIAAADAK